MTVIKNNFTKPKRHWDVVESMISGDRKRMIEEMANEGSFVAALGEKVIYEEENDE